MWKWRWGRNTVTTLMIRKSLSSSFAFCFLLRSQITVLISKFKLERQGKAEQACYSVFPLLRELGYWGRPGEEHAALASVMQSYLHVFWIICQLICNTLPKSTATVFEFYQYDVNITSVVKEAGCLLLSSVLKVILSLEVHQLFFMKSIPFKWYVIRSKQLGLHYKLCQLQIRAD